MRCHVTGPTCGALLCAADACSLLQPTAAGNKSNTAERRRLMQARPAGLHRQCLFGGLRIGLYDPVKAFYAKTLGIDTSQDVPFALKVASGLTTGALGIAIASPTDLVKVRQASKYLLIQVKWFTHRPGGGMASAGL